MSLLLGNLLQKVAKGFPKNVELIKVDAEVLYFDLRNETHENLVKGSIIS